MRFRSDILFVCTPTDRCVFSFLAFSFPFHSARAPSAPLPRSRAPKDSGHRRFCMPFRVTREHTRKSNFHQKLIVDSPVNMMDTTAATVPPGHCRGGLFGNANFCGNSILYAGDKGALVSCPTDVSLHPFHRNTVLYCVTERRTISSSVFDFMVRYPGSLWSNSICLRSYI